MSSIPGTSSLPPDIAEMQRMMRQLGRLIEISLVLNSTRDPDSLLQSIIAIATDLLECESVSILLYDEDEEKLRFSASSGSDPAELAKIPVPLDSSIAGEIFTQNKTMIINNAEEDERLFKQVDEESAFVTRTLIGVPMRIKDKVTGVLEALNKINGGFNKDDVDILSIIASQAAVAINNARLVVSLREAYAELSKIHKIKSDFMAIASHELRTPLIHVLGYAEMLQEDVDEELSGMADMVMKSALKLQGLVQDMTNMNLLEVGEQELALVKMPVQQIVAKAYQEMTNQIEAKGHTVNIKLPKEPITIAADSDRLEQAFRNVLHNAIRFTPDKGTLEIKAGIDSGRAVVSITDNGKGIPQDEFERIFDEFYQVESHMTREHGGLGLGLSIARGLVTLHKGKIWAESPGVDQGATFHIALPLAD